MTARNKFIVEGEIYSKINIQDSRSNNGRIFVNFRIMSNFPLNCSYCTDDINDGILKSLRGLQEGDTVKIEGFLSIKKKKNKYWHQVNIYNVNIE